MIYYGKSAVQAGGVFAKAVTFARKPRGHSNTSTSSSSAIRYTYNAAGDIVYDRDKGLTYSYNVLGLVSQVMRADGTGIQYRYAADGTLVTSTETQAAAGSGVAVSSRVFYLVGDRHDAMRGETYVQTPFGATLLDAGLSAKHVGFHADHLGNIILAYSDLNGDGFVDPSTEILEENRYYPSVWTGVGAPAQASKLPVYTRQSTALPFAYNGAEEQNSFGLHLTTYRTMAPEVAFWGQVDPKAGYNYAYSPYSSMNGNPISMSDPHGDLPFLVPIIVGAIIGGVTGGVVANNNGVDWWKGAIVGAIAGGALGAGVAAASGATGITTAAGVATKGWGVTTAALKGGVANMAVSAVTSGGDIDAIYKSGLTGVALGGFTASNGLGLVAKGADSPLANKLLFQAIGTSGRSVGSNWANGNPLLSRVTVGVGPVNLTFGKGQKLLQWQNNLGNIATNLVGLSNVAFGGGDVKFDMANLAPVYTDGFMKNWPGAWGAHSVMGEKTWTNSVLRHEMAHVWQSRVLGDFYLGNYAGQGILSALQGQSFISEPLNYFEVLANQW